MNTVVKMAKNIINKSVTRMAFLSFYDMIMVILHVTGKWKMSLLLINKK